MKKSIYFITGVCGVGKTSIMPHLKQLLNKSYIVHDFDKEGVPKNVDRAWRIKKTQYWIDKAVKNMDDGKSTIITGFSNPEEIEKMNHKEYVEVILLDASEDIIRQRLLGRYKTDESVEDLEKLGLGSKDKFVNDNVKFSSVLRKICESAECSIVQTDKLVPEEVAKVVAKLIQETS